MKASGPKGVGFGRRPFSCARWQRCHIRNAPFVLTQYGWFSLSQRARRGSTGASFREWQACHSNWSSLFSMEPVATGDVFEADPGGFPRSRSEPRSRKKL